MRKKNKLKENIKCLENLEKQLIESMESMKKIFGDIEKNKENLKLEVSNIFTKIRNIINEREDELLSEIDNQYNTKFINEDIIKKREKLPKQIKLSIEKGKSIDKEWDEKNLYLYINNCINIENNIKMVNIINDKFNKSNLNNKIKFKFIPKENQLDSITNIIKSFGKILHNNYSFKECPQNIQEGRKYILTGDNKNIVTKTGTDTTWMGTICENELDKSIEEHKWKIKILKTKSKIIMIRVAPIDFDINSSSYNTCGWYLYCFYSQPRLYSGPPFNYDYYESNLNEVNDEIIVCLTLKNKH